jgi:hypothetical protein
MDGNGAERTPDEKYHGFKRAFEIYSEHLNSGNAMAAFVVAFSIFEDRLASCYKQEKALNGQECTKDFVPPAKMVSFLYHHSTITEDQQKNWKELIETRNILFHRAMWEIDAFQLEYGQQAVQLAREADRISKRLRKLEAV